MLNSTAKSFGQLTDQELVVLIQQKQDYLGEVYKRCKPYAIRFMRNMVNNNNTIDLEDIYQDAIIILYEKLLNGNFELTASLQIYLNSVCRFQLFNRLKEYEKNTSFKDYSINDDDDSTFGYKLSITDEFDEIQDSKEDKFLAIERALAIMKDSAGHCYELLTLFWYHKKSMDEIAEIRNYTNGKNAKNQKSRCQEKLRIMTFNELNN